jgi:hypothetical protein
MRQDRANRAAESGQKGSKIVTNMGFSDGSNEQEIKVFAVVSY